MKIRQPKKLQSTPAPSSYQDCLEEAERIFDQAVKERGWATLPDQSQSFSSEAAQLRWFLLPSEAQELLRGSSVLPFKVPYVPRQYPVLDKSTALTLYDTSRYSTIPHRTDLSPDHHIYPSVEIVSIQPENESEKMVEERDDDLRSESSEPLDFPSIDVYDDDDEPSESLSRGSPCSSGDMSLWKSPVRSIMKPALEALLHYKMISNGDRVLVCVSGGKDSLSLLHTLRQYQRQAYRYGIEFKLGAITVDPGSAAYDPSPLIPYMETLGVPYYYERQCK